MECIDIEKLYKLSRITTTNADIPEEVENLILTLKLEGYFQGLSGMTDEEVIGTLILAGICTTVPKEKWGKIIPTNKED